MKHRLLWIVSLGSSALTLFFTYWWWRRNALEYNSQGRYFDPGTNVTHDKDALLVLGLLASGFALIALISWIRLIIQRTKN